MTGPPRTGDPHDVLIQSVIDGWKRKLLDLSKRNRALNFRPTKVSTVAIVDEQPAEVFRHLVLREKAMRFRPSEPADPSESPIPSGRDSPDLQAQATSESDRAWIPTFDLNEADDEHDLASAEYEPYDRARLDERHTDDWLQTTSAPDSLNKSLRRLDEQARLAIEEQGVNTLFLALGMLHYREAADSEETRRAPLVLVPVALARKSARSVFSVRIADDDPVINPALTEYLRLSFGLQLPRLPELASIADDYDLQDVLRSTAALVAGKAGWAVTVDSFLSLFSFQKLVMYKDLESNGPSIARHRLVGHLITRRGVVPQGHVVGLPDSIRDMDLDRDYAPEATFQVVDADSSQLRAIAAVSRNHDLVIEGPPGTGKSQTITNLIAQALSVGKSVLFVAEKMAALSVVHDRLQRAGLGDFCLELHSTKANKRAVMGELGRSLDASLQPVAGGTASTQRLPTVRATLSEYAQAVHAPHGSLGVSPYRAFGELGSVAGAPRIRYDGPISSSVTLPLVDQAVRDLDDVAVVARFIGDPRQHPWRDAAKTLYSPDDLAEAEALTQNLSERLVDLRIRAEAVSQTLGLPVAGTFTDVETIAGVADVMRRSPGVPLAVVSSSSWNQPPAEATALVERGRELNRVKARVAAQFTHDVLAQEQGPDIAHVESKAGLFGFVAIFDSRWRAIRKRWLAYRLPSYRESIVTQAADLRLVDRLNAERRAFASLDAKGRELFGDLWQRERSDWDAVGRYVDWVVEFRALCAKHGLAATALETASRPEPDVSAVAALQTAAAEARRVLQDLRAVVGWPADYLAGEPLDALQARVQSLIAGRHWGPGWATFESARRQAAASLGAGALTAALDGEISFLDMASAFRRAFWMRWISAVVEERPALARFHTLTHEERVAEFRRLDERVLVENRAALVGRLRDGTQHALRRSPASDAMPYLRQQLARQRHAPLRRTMKEAGAAVRAIKPCLLMSPLTVAQLLDGSSTGFDLVIFDEASQLPAEDAVGAIARGERLVVVGDPKQLPPTNFFAVSAGLERAAQADDGTTLYEDGESVLEDFMGAGLPMSRLKWHYRSKHESLIAYSNTQFYDGDLYIFPSIERSTETVGLQFEHVDGVYEGKGLNAIEARRVADEVVCFAREQLARLERGEPTQSLGVGTFNLRQQVAIQDELEQRRRADPTIEPFFDRGLDEPFFVKNLENIQGDQRDVIFISVTYARASDGRLRYNFGPLNGANGWRRLNVLVTRAQHRMRVFSSMRGDEISAEGTTPRGAQLLREFLLFAGRGRLESLSASRAADAETPFEAAVVRELTDRGLNVVPQVGTAGYRIDIGVLDDEKPGRFLCGIECDGMAYHSSETARDRDRLRQQVLESRGWVIHRVWSTDWFKDRRARSTGSSGL